MENSFRYSNGYYINLIILVIILALVGKGLISESLRINNQSFTIVAISIISFLTYITFKVWQRCATVIRITPEKITIKKPFHSISLKWDDISEVGRFKKRNYMNGACFHWSWYFFIKGREIDAKRVIIANEFLQDIRALLATIFAKASNAKFVTITDVSMIPFSKTEETSIWDKNEDLEQYDKH